MEEKHYVYSPWRSLGEQNKYCVENPEGTSVIESKLWGVSRKHVFYPRSSPARVEKSVSNDLTFPWCLLEEIFRFLEGSMFWADSSCLFSRHHYQWQVMKYSVSFDIVKVGLFQKGLTLTGCNHCILYESLQILTSCVHILTWR